MFNKKSEDCVMLMSHHVCHYITCHSSHIIQFKVWNHHWSSHMNQSWSCSETEIHVWTCWHFLHTITDANIPSDGQQVSETPWPRASWHGDWSQGWHHVILTSSVAKLLVSSVTKMGRMDGRTEGNMGREDGKNVWNAHLIDNDWALESLKHNTSSPLRHSSVFAACVD